MLFSDNGSVLMARNYPFSDLLLDSEDLVKTVFENGSNSI